MEVLYTVKQRHTRRHNELQCLSYSAWKLTLQEINTKPIEPKTELVCSRRQLLNYIYLLFSALNCCPFSQTLKLTQSFLLPKKKHNLKAWLPFRDHLPETWLYIISQAWGPDQLALTSLFRSRLLVTHWKMYFSLLHWVSRLANRAHDKHGNRFYLLQVTEVMRSSYVGECESYDQTKVKRGRTTDWT